MDNTIPIMFGLNRGLCCHSNTGKTKIINPAFYMLTVKIVFEQHTS